MKALRAPVIATCGALWGASVALLVFHDWQSPAGVALGLIACGIAVTYAAVTVALKRNADRNQA